MYILSRRVGPRDDFTCQVCGRDCNEYFEVGHKIDRMMGGLDTLNNVCVMCYTCNRCKPLHRTLEEYEAWVKAGGILPRFFELFTEMINSNERITDASIPTSSRHSRGD